MKNLAIFFLFCLGIAGYAVCRADAAPPEEVVYQATIAAGKYHFYCKNKLLFFKSHRDKGMEGVLEVIQ